MSPKTIACIAVTALLAAVLGLSACGIKGDPIRPGSDEDPKKKQTTN
jgi:predicted small lipoprotein YifL